MAWTLNFFLLHFHYTVSLHLGPYLKGECMNKKAKPQKQSLVVEDQNDMGFGSVPPGLGGVRVQ